MQNGDADVLGEICSLGRKSHGRSNGEQSQECFMRPCQGKHKCDKCTNVVF